MVVWWGSSVQIRSWFRQKEEEEEANCCTWLEPRSVDWRAKHDASVDVCFSFRGRRHDCILQYMLHKGSEKGHLLKLWNIKSSSPSLPTDMHKLQAVNSFLFQIISVKQRKNLWHWLTKKSLHP